MAARGRSLRGMRGLATVPSYVVMQPTTLCNLDCAYCYLPFRAADRRMPVTVAEAVATSVNRWAASGRFSVVWHGGEPLAAGRAHLAALMAPFAPELEHHVQTNATLIDDAWCEFFATHQMRVSVSVDGPRDRNSDRVTRSGRPAYDRIVRGVAALRRHGLPFSALAVVNDPAPGRATELYEYCLDLGCEVLGVNIEETEGVNTRDNSHDAAAVTGFWAELVTAWRRDPRIHLREVEWSLRYAAAVLDGSADDLLPGQLDPIPTVAYDGSVVVLSPELAGFTDPHYGDFTSGNVLDTPLHAILAAAAGTPWVGEFMAGVEACRSSCAYFGFCGGGHAANRYFELRRFDGTETEHCRNSKIRLLEGVLEHARDHQSP
ncbi:radical SAM/SPASM domain-containing protein [Micromonospora endophytica]|uniref:Radical SAM/SPASM domain-containing protein n=2 Tax=Micromonospora endophytica TaxID=515350 RepID=A0A2W2DG66_9ACTN|nr:cyclophane-forming radical SAM peptide maturase AmcB [Micromonospora endophytica]PZF91733.1 radical SAM/SPASM domain-containing protein [Micromonospora endophytica]RIW46837.1 radical SAM protein [Micromonospora endophytica]BCJ59232.1 radical SAM protein [Micromonospora endophytica]